MGIRPGHRHAATQAKGNPLAVGLIALGIGWLASSLIPASTPQKIIAPNVKGAVELLVDEVSNTAKTVGENLKRPLTDAADAADAVKESATDTAGTVKSETVSSAAEVPDEAQHGDATPAG